MVTGSPPIPRDAATVLILREAEPFEVYMVRRSSASPFVPDVFVFPGGAVDPGDLRLSGEETAGEPTLRVTAARESFEEAGILFAGGTLSHERLTAARAAFLAHERTFVETLAELGVELDPSALVPFSRWITPPTEVRRFDARFFLARLPPGQIATADAYETEDGIWIAPQTALERNRAGTFAMIFPTIKHLARLARFATVDELLTFARTKTIVTVQPHGADLTTFALPPELEDAW